MSRICLVSCASKKTSGRRPAKDLYASALFTKSRKYAERHADRWFILSAKYGLLSPDEIIETYDVTLNHMSSAERRAWADQVYRSLTPMLRAGDRVVILAGQAYSSHLVPRLVAHGALVERPLEGLRIGEQLKWLKDLGL